MNCGDMLRYGMIWKSGAKSPHRFQVMITATLTDKEQALYDAIMKGMDEPGCGWLHELAPQTLSTNAVLGNLIKKGLVHSHKEPGNFPGMPPAYWVTIEA